MRAEKEPARQHHLQALQNTFKILINSFYGYLGFGQGHFADFDAAARVTQIGRDLLKKMIDWLNAHGAKVIEVDTDGIYFVPPNKIDMLMKTDTLQDSLDKYRAKIAGSARNRAAAYELALASGRAYKPGDQVSYYIKSTPKKVPAYEAARLATHFDPQNRDENVDYYVAKLNELMKKFGGLTAAASPPRQESLAL